MPTAKSPGVAGIGVKRIESGTRWPFVIWWTQVFERSPLSRSGSPLIVAVAMYWQYWKKSEIGSG